MRLYALCIMSFASACASALPVPPSHPGLALVATTESPQAAALVSAQRTVERAQANEASARQLAADSCDDWPLWQSYAARFVSDDGRAIDHGAQARSTSEGQAYALFFALVANDRARFERILRWTELNLAGASLREHLPAWHWGERADGSWGVLDANAASDADVFIAYALLEAARAWSVPEYQALGLALAGRIARQEGSSWRPMLAMRAVTRGAAYS